jgi:hypothetical protein
MDRPPAEFGHRKPQVAPSAPPPVKRSRHVALLLMGTVAVGGGAYALMPPENCTASPPGVAGSPGPTTACGPRGSSGSGGHGFYGGSSQRTGLFGGDGSSNAGSATAEGGTTRGGFGAFARAFGAHFSFGG